MVALIIFSVIQFQKKPNLIQFIGVAEIILRTQTKLSLKCAAAKAIQTYKIPYQGFVPHSLIGFIDLHGCGECATDLCFTEGEN